MANGKLVLGMVHLRPLPGTPFHEHGDLDRTLAVAVESARALHQGGADGCLVQTVERVYGVADESDPARTAAMALIVREITRATGDGFQVGVQLMRNAIKASLAVASVAGGTFVRAGALVGRTLTEHGMVVADPLGVAEYRNKIGAQGVRVFADIDSGHFTWYGPPRSTGEVASAAARAGADAVVLGRPDETRTLEMIASVRAARPDLPIILAGHTDHGNAARLLKAADGAFVGTCLERDGWGGSIDPDLVRSYVDIVRNLEPENG
ncbi:BtpA/SgcQ family protein [Sphaerisporangium corydalis]|uniref:BtpA/SgcQ family protein n=1 Tax=Sphaerisporangium corydalis TaxID=1441875 RepID=A0ABV9E8W2_9ACTN|nr:BtpA/SgcQ family protein [Sphaerisporangium corydalis]